MHDMFTGHQHFFRVIDLYKLWENMGNLHSAGVLMSRISGDFKIMA